MIVPVAQKPDIVAKTDVLAGKCANAMTAATRNLSQVEARKDA